MSLHEGLASQTALPSSAASTGPTQANMSLTVGEVHAHGIAERIDAVRRAWRRLSTSLTSLSPPYWLRIEENASIRRCMLGAISVDLSAHITEAGGQRVGPVRQSVEVLGAVADHGRSRAASRSPTMPA